MLQGVDRRHRSRLIVAKLGQQSSRALVELSQHRRRCIRPCKDSRRNQDLGQEWNQVLVSTLYKMRRAPGTSLPYCRMVGSTPTILQ